MGVEVTTLYPSETNDPTSAPGDASARCGALAWAWSNTEASNWIGTDNKSLNPENVMFIRYDLTGISRPDLTLGERYMYCDLKLWPQSVLLDGPEGKFRVGWLVLDGIYNNGNSVGFTEGVGSGKYTDSTELPFPTLPGSDAVIAGKIFLDSFAGTVEYTDTSHIYYGDAASPDLTHAHDTNATYFQDLVDFWLSLSRPYFALVLDPYEVPASNPEHIVIFTADNNLFGSVPLGTLGPQFRIAIDRWAEYQICAIGAEVNPVVSVLPLPAISGITENVGLSVAAMTSNLGAVAHPITAHVGTEVASVTESLGTEVGC